MYSVIFHIKIEQKNHTSYILYLHKQVNMNIQFKISAVLVIATAFLTSSIVAGPSIVYAQSYGGLGGFGGLGSPLGIGGIGGLGSPSGPGGIGDLSPLSPSLGIQGKPIFPLSQFNL